MKVNYNSWHFLTGASIILILIISYFIKIPVSSGPDYISYSRILGVIIFYNPFILGIYILLAVILILKAIKK